MTPEFWEAWTNFEVANNGNEEDLREMLRIKRSVQAIYNTQVRLGISLLVMVLVAVCRRILNSQNRFSF